VCVCVYLISHHKFVHNRLWYKIGNEMVSCIWWNYVSFYVCFTVS